MLFDDDNLDEGLSELQVSLKVLVGHRYQINTGGRVH